MHFEKYWIFLTGCSIYDNNCTYKWFVYILWIFWFSELILRSVLSLWPSTYPITPVVYVLCGSHGVRRYKHTTTNFKFIVYNFYKWQCTVCCTWRTGYHIHRMLVSVKVHALNKHRNVFTGAGNYYFSRTHRRYKVFL